MLTEIELPSLEYICLNLRDVDKREVYNVLDHDNPMILAMQAYYVAVNKGRGRIAWHNGRPAAYIAVSEERPTVWSVSLFGTADFKAVAVDCVRWLRPTIVEMISERGGRRLHCDSHVDHREAHAFLTMLGARPEGPPMRHFGKDGSDYQRFVWITSDAARGFEVLGPDGLAIEKTMNVIGG